MNLAEVASKVYRQAHRADDLLDVVYSHPNLLVSHLAVERLAGKLHARRPSSKVSLADCFAAALALERDESLATGDRDLLGFRDSHGLKVELLGA